jgi:low temperature requirement protein LtrA
MVARPTDEEHRSATALELFFDLCFVVAVAQAASTLHHQVADGHAGEGVVGYASVFFAIWWAWMNFTWFASAYDTDDIAYRLTTLVQIAGALILAAGVPQAMDGLFTLIVLGESVLASTLAIQLALAEDAALADLATTAAGGLLTVFGMWWLYFSKESHELLTSLRAGIVWGYGHYLIFAAAAAVGAGLAVNVDFLTSHAEVGARAAAAAFTVPVALFLTAVWALQVRPHHQVGRSSAVVPAAAVLVLASTFTSEPVLVTGLLVAAMIATTLVALHRPAAA